MTLSRINKCFNLEDFRSMAEARLPSPLYHYIEGGADDEITRYHNTEAFNNYQIVPRCLEDVTSINMQTTVLGCSIDWPVILAPTGMTRFFHHEGERAVARAADHFNILYSLSTVSTTTIEDVAASTNGPKMFQLYALRDPAINEELIDRCRLAKYDALCLTVDTVVQGNRERDLRSGMTVPPKPTLKSLLAFASRPGWCYRYFTTPALEMANLAHHIDEGSSRVSSLGAYINNQFDRALNWSVAEKIAQRWQGAFAIKGILSVDDARRARDIGATAVIISNHGGRQLDTTPAPIELVADIADGVGNTMDIILDGGVRRGTHVLKALAMGAKACMIGRPYLYGVAAGGQAGVERVLQLLKNEIERGMILSGRASISDLDRRFIRKSANV